MNKFLCSIVFVLSFFSVHAHAQDLQEEMKKLVERVDSLEHALSYLNLTYELSTLNSDMAMFSNDMHTNSIEIQLKLYNRELDTRYFDACLSYYKSCQVKKQSLSRLIEIRKKNFHVKVLAYPYSEAELNALWACYNVIDFSYDNLERSMDLLKFVIDAYEEDL